MGNIFSTPHIRSHHPPSNVQQTPDRVTIADGLAHFLNQHGEYIRHKRESSEWRHGRRMEKDQQNQQQEESLNGDGLGEAENNRTYRAQRQAHSQAQPQNHPDDYPDNYAQQYAQSQPRPHPQPQPQPPYFPPSPRSPQFPAFQPPCSPRPPPHPHPHRQQHPSPGPPASFNSRDFTPPGNNTGRGRHGRSRQPNMRSARQPEPAGPRQAEGGSFYISEDEGEQEDGGGLGAGAGAGVEIRGKGKGRDLRM